MHQLVKSYICSDDDGRQIREQLHYSAVASSIPERERERERKKR